MGLAFNDAIKELDDVPDIYERIGECLICSGKMITETMSKNIETEQGARDKIIEFVNNWGVGAGCKMR
jgi:hypothetical protein